MLNSQSTAGHGLDAVFHKPSRPGHAVIEDPKKPKVPMFLLQLMGLYLGATQVEVVLHTDLRSQLSRAFESGLRHEFPAPLGALLADAVLYCRQEPLSRSQLAKLVDLDSGAVLRALFKNTADGTTMRLINSAMVGCALLGDAQVVGQWAQEGLTRCRRIDESWARTATQWQWVMDNTVTYIQHVQELRRFVARNTTPKGSA